MKKFKFVVLIGLVLSAVFSIAIASDGSAATAITITAPTSGSSAAGTSFTVTGTATPARNISVKVNGSVVGTTTSDSGGNWSLQVTGQSPGAKTIEATASTELLYGNVIVPSALATSFMTKINTINDTQEGSFSIVSGGGSFSFWAPNSTFTKAYGEAPVLSSTSVFPIDLSTETVTNFTMAGTGPIPSESAFNADNSKVYITSSSNDIVRVYNTTTNAEIGSGIAVGDGPIPVVKRPNHNEIWVVNITAGTISVINTTSDTVTATYNPNGTNDTAQIAFSPDGETVYVGGDASGDIYVLNGDSGALSTTITASLASAPAASMVVNNDGTKLYAVSIATNAVQVYNLSNNTYQTSIAVSSGPLGLALTSDNSFLYVSLPNLIGGANGTTIAKINTSTNSVISNISVGGAAFYLRMSSNELASTTSTFTLTSASLADTGLNIYAVMIIAGALLLSGSLLLSRVHNLS